MALRGWWLAVTLVLQLVGCGSPNTPPKPVRLESSQPTEPSVKRAEVGVDGSQRLGRNVLPLEYDLWLAIDPTQTHFAGRTRINLRVHSATTRLDLHASRLDISKIELINRAQQRVAARLVPGPNAGLTVIAEQPVQGDWQLAFEYEAALDEVPESIYRVKQGDDWYVYSQFEALMAREAFPCFDEPGFKTPFHVRIRVPQGLTALSNAPLTSVHTETSEYQTFEFAPTARMPTYLVAFAAGKFAKHQADVEAEAAGRPPGQTLPHNVYTVAGKEHLARYAGAQTTPVLRALTNYFGSPYPYPKLDQIGVPTFLFGAMENVGLVTYRENILLLDDTRASHRDRAVARSVMAHELAHMWFGDLVTPAWWDDIWLNEAFATWMSNKVLEQVAPELEAPLWAVSGMLEVMQDDALSSAKPIRKVIATTGDIQNAFDGITYEKGFAVLRMLETWIGKDTFQRGVRAYLERHAFGNATMADFMNSISEQTPLPVERVAKSFIEQPGTPLISVQNQCTPSADGVNLTIRLSQKRYVPLGVDPTSSRGKTSAWSVPVCLRLLDAKSPDAKKTDSEVSCTVLDGAQHTFELARKRCPVAIHANANEAGYYHFELSDAEWLELTTKHFARLSLAERVALPHHALALLQSGDIELSTFVQVLKTVASDPHRLVVEGVIFGLDRLNSFAESPELSALVGRLLAPHAKRVGLHPKPGEPNNNALLRPAIFATLGRFAADPQLRRAAAQTLAQFNATPNQVPLEALQILLPIAARNGDATTYATLAAQLPQAPPGVREVLIEALGSFPQPELQRKTYDLILSGEIRPTERWTMIRPATSFAARYAIYFDWYLKNESALLDRMGDSGKGSVPWDASSHCTKAERDQVAAHFQPIERYGSGAADNLAQTLETIDRCVALKERFGSQTQTFSN